MASCLITHKKDPSAPECSMAGMKQTIRDSPKLLVIHTQNGCPHCMKLKEILGKMSSQLEGIEIAELNEGNTVCSKIASSWGLGVTPEVLYFENGKEKEHSVLEGLEDWEIRRNLIRIVNQ